MTPAMQTVLNAIQQLNGQIIESHVEIFELCDENIKTKRRVRPEIDRLIDAGKITENRPNIDGFDRFKYEVVS